jgi:hypothetical protein
MLCDLHDVSTELDSALLVRAVLKVAEYTSHLYPGRPHSCPGQQASPILPLKPALPAPQERFLLCHSKAVLDAVESDARIASPDVLAAVAEVHKALQAIREAAVVLPSSNSQRRCKAQQDVADVDLELFTDLRQQQCC